MKKRTYLMLASLLAISSLMIPAYAFKAKDETKSKRVSKHAVKVKEEKLLKAPKFPKGEWLNSAPLTEKTFKKHVTLVYFWDYSSINCIREIENIKRIARRYEASGLSLIWVHSPEFEFAGKPDLVRKASDRFGITQPVFLDNDFKLWDAYGIRSWPTKVLVNEDGKIAATFVGEENLRKVETKTRQLLNHMNPKAALPERIVKKERKGYSEYCGVMSGETYVGYKRAGWWGASIANQKWVPKDQPFMFKDRGQRVERGFFLNGLWKNEEDAFEHTRSTSDLTDYLGLIYMGHEVYSMVKAAGEKKDARIYVTRDEGPVPPEMRGQDLKVDDEGQTYFNIEEPRLYYLISNEDQDVHELRLWIKQPGISIQSFAFSNRCLSEFEHH